MTLSMMGETIELKVSPNDSIDMLFGGCRERKIHREVNFFILVVISLT